jgi:hypothetical protein
MGPSNRGMGLLAEALGWKTGGDAEEVAVTQLDERAWWNGPIEDWAVLRPSVNDSVMTNNDLFVASRLPFAEVIISHAELLLEHFIPGRTRMFEFLGIQLQDRPV